MRQRRDEQDVADDPMVELHRQRVLESVQPRGLQEQQAVRDQRAAHQRPGVRSKTGVEAGDQPAEEDLQEDQAEQDGAGDAKPRRGRWSSVRASPAATQST